MSLSPMKLEQVLPGALYTKGTLADFDTTTVPGLYLATSTRTQNFPPGAKIYGMLEVIDTGYFIFQRYTTYDCQMYIRRMENGKWNAWYTIGAVKVQLPAAEAVAE